MFSFILFLRYLVEKGVVVLIFSSCEAASSIVKRYLNEKKKK